MVRSLLANDYVALIVSIHENVSKIPTFVCTESLFKLSIKSFGLLVWNAKPKTLQNKWMPGLLLVLGALTSKLMLSLRNLGTKQWFKNDITKKSIKKGLPSPQTSYYSSRFSYIARFRNWSLIFGLIWLPFSLGCLVERDE